MAYLFIAALLVLVPAALALTELLRRCGMTGRTAAVALSAYAVGSFVLGFSALVWVDYATIEDFDQTTRHYVHLAREAFTLSACVVVGTWLWALRLWRSPRR